MTVARRPRRWLPTLANVLTATLVPAALGAALVLVACTDSTGPGEVTPITELPRPLTDAELRVLGGSNAFAFDLGRELLPEAPNDNLFWSPLSASMLLGMIMNGTDGDTWDQMRDVLGFDGMSEDEINDAYLGLIELLTELDPTVQTAIGNSTWTDAGFPVIPAFEQRVAEHFDAEARELDLQDPTSLDAINAWASDATNGRIERIFDELPANAVMVLLNALYFKASWTTEFDRDRTEAAPFTRPDGSTVTADLMYLEETLVFGGDPDVAVVDLPYGGGAFSMTLAVPRGGVAVDDVVRSLDQDRWNGWLEGMTETDGVVRLPRFELEWQAKLNGPLQALGMTDAFDPDLADFTRLTPGGGVWLDLVKQKTFVKVDEEGTEAAAVSAGVAVDSAPLELRADRPFLFVLRERLSGTILFMGVVNDPTA